MVLTLKFEPRPYQLRAMKLMMQQSSLGLFLDPGLGKTAAWLSAFVALQEVGFAESMLVIAPINPLYGTWPTEIAKYDEFSHLSWCFLHGKDKDWHLSNTKADIYLINPEGIQWLTSRCDPSKLAEVLCVDESTKFKSSTSKRFKSMRPFFPRFDRRWIGTGTPSPNGLMDLFGQAFILDGGNALGKYITHFRNKWFYTQPWNEYEYIPHAHAFEEITQALAPLVVVMEATDYLDMPELNIVDRFIKLPAKARKAYDELEKEFLTVLAPDKEALVAPTVAAAGIKCRQICNGAVYDSQEGRVVEVLHNEKLDELDELSEEIGEHPILVVYEFQHDVQRIRKVHPDWVVMGEHRGQQLKELVDKFNAGEISRLLIQSSQAHGLNIQAGCHHMVWFGMTWNWEDYKQMVDRLYRQGQASNMVMVYRILAENSLDVDMANVIENKRLEESNVKRRLTEIRGNIGGGSGA